MSVIYKKMTSELIADTTMYEGYIDGNLVLYKIKAADGYVLHDKRGDHPVCDDELNESGEFISRFRVGTASVPASYDFDNVVEDTYNGINGAIQVQKTGKFEFYAIPASEVPECDKW